MVPAGNKAKCLSLVNYTTKTIRTCNVFLAVIGKYFGSTESSDLIVEAC